MSRNTTNDVRNFSIYSLKKWGKLQPECWCGYNSIVWSRDKEEVSRIGYTLSTVTDDSYIELDYRTQQYGDEEWKPIKYKVPLLSVKCNYGGVRWFFKCPLSVNGRYCGRRVAILYKAGDYFGCRHCANLTYESCNESKRFRSGMFKILSDSWKADDFYETLKRTHYRGKPTRKYRKYLRLSGHGVDMRHALVEFERQLLKR